MSALSDDKGFPLRVRICMSLGIDSLTDDEGLYAAIQNLSLDALNASETIRVHLCAMLDLDYCTDKDMDIYHVIAIEQTEAAALRERVAALEAALRPFAQYAGCIMPEFDDDMLRDSCFPCRDFRRAAALLSESAPK